MAGLLKEYLSPPQTSFRDSVTVLMIGAECLGLDMLAIDTATAGIAWTANLLCAVPLITAEPLLVTNFFWYNTATVNGNTDVGIYSADGATKLGSTGSTPNAGANQGQFVNSTDFTLPGNSRLWLVIGSDSATHTYAAANLVIAGLEFVGVQQQASGWSSGLPTSLTLAAPSQAKLPIFGFTGASVI